jgi:hypothetical protein
MSTSFPDKSIKKALEDLQESIESLGPASAVVAKALTNFEKDARLRDRVVDLNSDEGASMKEEMEKGREGGGKRDEQIIAIYAYDEDDKPLWFFREWSVSSIFRHVFGSNWEMRVYSNRFFENLLKQLDDIKTRQPLLVTMSIHYEWMMKEGTWKGTKDAIVGISGHSLRLETLTGDFLLEDVASLTDAG